jgi:nitroreductase
MAMLANAREVTNEMRKVRQARLYRPDPVPDDVLDELLEVARWTGSSRNSQPWHFVVVTDKEALKQISELRAPIAWVADAPLAIAIILDGKGASEMYDEGRVTERLLVAARLLGLGGGTAWFGDAAQEQKAKEILGVPADRAAHSVVVLGYPTTLKDHRPNANIPGRKSLAEIVSYNQFGTAQT